MLAGCREVVGDDAGEMAVGTILADGGDMQQFDETGARPVDAAFHGADGAAADFGGLLLGKPLRRHQNKSLALLDAQEFQRLAHLGQIDEALLLGMHGQPRGKHAVMVRHFAA